MVVMERSVRRMLLDQRRRVLRGNDHRAATLLNALGHLVAGEHEFEGASKDRDDDKYIAGAVEGRAAFLVAGDSDLLDLKEYDGLRIVRPRVFLGLLVA